MDLEHKKTAEALNKQIREYTKLNLLNKIKHDINICQLEGWDYKTFLLELKDMIDGFLRCK